MKYREIEIDILLGIVRQAGEAILEIYDQNFSVENKTDNSPLTEADKKSNTIILEELKKYYPNIPFISEETKLIPYDERKNWNCLWLIDPLDGTKEFIKRNGEFTVNIALIEKGVPVIGMVHVPVTQVTYAGIKEIGSYKLDANNLSVVLHNSSHYTALEKVKIVASRSHLNGETVDFVEQIKSSGKQVEFISSGSSLKFCLVAEGTANVYPRFAPTMEWDTAAAHAVALYAGKNVLNAQTRQPLTYNKENLLNPYFIVE